MSDAVVELFQLDIITDQGGTWEAMRVRLTCGCWSLWHASDAAYWDAPGEAVRCRTHGRRQINIFVQSMLMAGEHRQS
jgi:hypothetical protein